MRIYALALILSAFLLFLIQPIAGRILLPQFGGSASVWSACLLFFQCALLIGYVYSHLLVRLLRPKWQSLVHIALVAASILTLRFGPDAAPIGPGDPTTQLLWRLGLMIGLPFFLLSSSTPLLQAWYARTHGSELPYRLFAYSNAGSLAALVAYPFLIEPALTLRSQRLAWSVAFCVFAVFSGTLALLSSRKARAFEQAAPDQEGEPPRASQRLLWILLAACSSALLLAVTNLLTKDVAPVPLLWILPLALYLLSFVLCFARGRWYSSGIFGWLLTPALFALTFALAYAGTGTNLILTVALLSAGFFLCCMFCHGGLARLKPEPRYLTGFYLMVSLGGALGGIFVALLAPHLFRDYFEFPIALAACAGLAWWLSVRDMASTVRLGLTLALILYVADIVYTPDKQAKLLARNFYGTLKVIDSGQGSSALRTLLHGGISHGSEFLAAERRRQPTAYYGPFSGGALAIQQQIAGNRRIGLVGLGPGTLAAYGRPGDTFRFYELNPLVIQVAKTEFSYIRDCPARVDIIQGDARLSLEREPDQRFDVLLLDAFSGDSIPVHLLTKEAFQLYLRHLRPGGVLAVHVSNRFLDFRQVVAKLAASAGLSSLAVLSAGNVDEQTLAATWILVTADKEFLESPVFGASGKKIAVADRMRLWTDDYSNLLQVLR